MRMKSIAYNFEGHVDDEEKMQKIVRGISSRGRVGWWRKKKISIFFRKKTNFGCLCRFINLRMMVGSAMLLASSNKTRKLCGLLVFPKTLPVRALEF